MSTAPKLDSTLPDTPLDEWASNTTNAIHTSPTPLAAPPTPGTPGLDIPGSYPSDPSLNTSANRVGAKETLHHTAEAYIAPERLDRVEHLVEGVGNKAALYVPKGVASAVSSYWCESFYWIVDFVCVVGKGVDCGWVGRDGFAVVVLRWWDSFSLSPSSLSSSSPLVKFIE